MAAVEPTRESPTRIALVREVSEAIGDCLLTHQAPAAIDVARAREQHAAYCSALADAGCDVVRLPAAHDMPDAVFVEDTAVVVDEVAIVCRPGAPGRRREVPAVADALTRWRLCRKVEAPATVDGGDILVAGRTVFVGLSSRTNAAGVEAVRRTVEPLGYTVTSVGVRGCLHLKSAVTQVAKGTLLLYRPWIESDPFAAFDVLEPDPAEPAAANALAVDGCVLVGAHFPRTAERLSRAGLDVRAVPADELARAEGGLTCSSLVFEADPPTAGDR